MITTALLQIVYVFLGGILALLPIGHLPTAMTTAFAYFFGIANQFTYIFPVYTLMTAVGILFAFDAIVLLWHFIQWTIRKIPGMQ